METVRIRDPGWKKSRIRDPDKHPGSATMDRRFVCDESNPRPDSDPTSGEQVMLDSFLMFEVVPAHLLV
jgi:hypothetical protein